MYKKTYLLIANHKTCQVDSMYDLSMYENIGKLILYVYSLDIVITYKLLTNQ